MAKATRRHAARLHLLTAKEVQHAGLGDHGDGGGLALRVQADSCAWDFRYTAPSGRRREMGLGACLRGSVAQAADSLTAARDQAHKARELLRQSIGPLQARENARAAARQAEDARKAARAVEHWTLARCARDYHERVIEPTKTTKHAAQWIASLENHVPAALWKAPIRTLTAPGLLAALQAVEPHARARNLPAGQALAETVQRLRQRLDAVFEDAIFHGRADANPAAAIKRKLSEAAPPRQRGQLRALAYHQAPALMAALRQAPGTAARCLEFAVLTAARTSEALRAKWGEFDLSAGVWTVPASRMKGGEPHTVHLSPAALAVLQQQAGQDPRWVFPSPARPTYEPAPLSNMALLAVLGRLSMRDRTTVHGLCRATFSTWANDTAAARPDVIEACLAHEESTKVRAAYNRASFDAERRALLRAWGDFLAHSAQVIQLPGCAA